MIQTDDVIEHLPRQPILPAHVKPAAIAVVGWAEPATARRPRSQPGLHRAFWRWHFYAGVLVGPVLFVVAVTGALYVFKHELERVIYADTMFVLPRGETISLDRQVAAVEDFYAGWRAETVEIDSDPTRATSVRIRRDSSESQRAYVDPHTGEVQGALDDASFFRIVLAIHRRLFIGSFGRIVVELTTCWTIVLLVTGLYLWRPRRRAKFWGVVAPRLRAKPYTVLRDLHAVVGAWAAPVAFVIAGTGLIYSLAWGSLYKSAAIAAGGTAETYESASPPSAAPLPLDRALAIAREHCPDASFIDIQLPALPRGALVVRAKSSEREGPRDQTVLILDRSTGAAIAVKTSDQLPALNWWRTTWNYPLHVGSVLGTLTKVIWLAACLVLAALPAVGLCMWWKRRPHGQTGLPRRLERRLPWGLIVAIAALGALLPAVGASILLILAGEWIACRAPRKLQRAS